MCIVFRHGYRGFVHASILLLFQFVFGLAAPLAAQEAATQAPPAKVHHSSSCWTTPTFGNGLRPNRRLRRQ